MEYKLIMAVSGFPGLYDSGSLTYRDLNMRSEAWRRVAEVVGVPESECRRKWKSLRDQHRRERQRERERRESGIGLFNYRPWRYSAILSFLNPFIDARAAGTNGWALDPLAPHLLPAELGGCSTTTELRSDDDDNYGIAVADATTTTASSSSSSSYSEFVQRKRPSAGSGDAVRLKEAKTETPSVAADTDTDATNAAAAANAAAQSQQAQHVQMKELLEMMMHSVTSLASCLASSHSSSSSSQLLDQSALLQNPSRLKTEEQEVVMREFLDQTDEDENEDDVEDLTRDLTECPRPPRAKRKSSSSSNGLLEEFLRRMETRDAQRNRDRDQRDDVTLFLLSLAPAMRRLSSEKQSWVRTRIQQLLHEAEFGATSFH